MEISKEAENQVFHNQGSNYNLTKEEYAKACKEFEDAFAKPWPQGGAKFDQNKPRMELLDADFLEDVARVLTNGAKKYGSNNWRSGLSYSRLIGAAFRHLIAILRGEDTDPEWGLPHTAHLACEVMFLHWMIKNRKDLDDRWNAGKIPNTVPTVPMSTHYRNGKERE